MKTIKSGRPASTGVAVGRAWVVEAHDNPPPSADIPAAYEPSDEAARFDAARAAAVERLAAQAPDNEAYSAGASLADSPLLSGNVKDGIEHGKSAGQALRDACSSLGSLLSSSSDEYLRGQAADFGAVCSLIADALKGGIAGEPLSAAPPGAVVVARTLDSVDLDSLDFGTAAALVVASDDNSRHTDIVARARGIPAVVGVGNDISVIADGATVVVDASGPEIIVAPDRETLERYLILADDYKAEIRRMKGIGMTGAVTRDGRQVTVLAAADDPRQVRDAVDAGADGIGRLGPSFLARLSPGEDSWFAAYRECARTCGQRPLVICAMPYGGVSADEIKIQLRAALRAGSYGNVKVMFPSVASVDELRRGAALMEECRMELRRRGEAYDENSVAGVEIDSPSAVMVADALAAEAGFFCIGADGLARSMSAAGTSVPTPAVVRAVKAVADAAAAAGIDCELCGAAASAPRNTPLLVGLGIDRLCVDTGSVQPVKERVEALYYSRSRELAFRALGTLTAAQMEKLVSR